ncbi:RHS repeat-associated core domain-containing protein, partial [Burkholderia sp. Bp9140]|uniref:RHS repeat-associated core domain-containing protein n=1 Tax=Burkholderia sp. Bp9140 TaxID=2184572 RepID=UPI002892EB01
MVREDPDDADSVPVAQRMHTFRERHQWQGASLYLHEPGTFVPLARLDETLVEAAFVATDAEGRFVQVPAKTRHATLFYQNDHLGTPQELLDESGKVVWVGRYRAWGGEKVVWRETPEQNEAGNAIRFQGQYRDEETGLHYNRYRYYDPGCGRFVSRDPIGLAGGLNVFQYAPNPIEWIDPLGLSPRCVTSRTARRNAMRQAGIPTSQQPISQSKNDSGWEYRYEIAQAGGGTIQATAQQQTMDVSHRDEPHWEAGKVKIDPISGKTRMNAYGRPKIANPKGKAYYGNCS